jgi:hypothetical protein
MVATLRFYKDHQWTSVKNMKLGLSTGKYIERLSVFGPNIINIHEKPIMKLLTDEVSKSKGMGKRPTHLILLRSSIHSMSSKSVASSCGAWMITITMLSASLSLVPLVSSQHWWKQNRYGA